MKQKLLFLSLFLMTIVTGAWADDEPAQKNVASVTINGTTTDYPTIEAAWVVASAGSKATLTLLDNCSFSNPSSFLPVYSTSDITFDGGDYALTIKDQTYLSIRGKLTVKSGKISIKNTLECGAAVKLNGGELVMEGGIIDAGQSGYSCIKVFGSTSKITMTGGELWGNLNEGGAGGYAIDLIEVPADIKISGGILKGYSGAVDARKDYMPNNFLPSGGYCFVMKNENNPVSDGFEFVEPKQRFIDGSSSEGKYFTVMCPVASTQVDILKKVYSSFQNAWNDVNKPNAYGFKSLIYLLKDQTITSSLSPAQGALIELNASKDVTLTHNGSDAMFKINNAKSGGEVKEGLTINSGIYKSNQNVIEVTNTFPVVINYGEYSTTGSGAFDIYCESEGDIDCKINGGTYKYSTVNGGSIHVKSGWTVGAGLPSGKAFWENFGSLAPILYSNLNTNNLQMTVSIFNCAHGFEGASENCKYCNKTGFKNIAKIGDTGYKQLKDAFDAAVDGATVELISDHALVDGDYINVTKNVTFNVGTYTLTGNKACGTDGVAGLLHMGTEGKTLTIAGTTGDITNSNTSGAAVSLNAGNVVTGTDPTYKLSSLATTGNVTISQGFFNKLIVKAQTTTVETAGINLSVVNAVVDGGELSIVSGIFGFNPEAYTVPTSLIVPSSSSVFWTVSKNGIAAHVTIGSTTTRCATVEEALAKANAATYKAATIKIVKDVESAADFKITTQGDVTFEGGEYTFTVPHQIVVDQYSTLIMNSGTIKSTRTADIAFKLEGTLKMNGGTIDCTEYGGGAIDVVSDSPSLTIKGGEIKGSKYALVMHENFNPAFFHISGGTFTVESSADDACVFYIPSWANTQHNANRLLKMGYDLYAQDGSVINANTKEVKVKYATVAPASTFTTSDNLKYRVTSITNDKYTVACTGYDDNVLTSIAIPATVTDPNNSINVFVVDAIADDAFSNKINLHEVILSNNIKTIGRSAFYRTGLTEITIPENVERIERFAFFWINPLTTINYNAGNVQNTDYNGEYTPGYYSPFSSSEATVTALNIGEHVQNIPDGMFYSLGSSESVTNCTITAAPTTAPTIGENTFGTAVKESDKVFLVTSNPTDDSYLAWGFRNYSPSSFTKLALSDTQTTIYNGTYAAGKLTYTREGLTSGNYASIAVPFNYNITSGCGIAKAYQPIGISLFDEDGTLNVYFNEVTTVSAGTPVLAKLNAATISVQNKEATTISSTPVGSETENAVYKKTGEGSIVAKDNTTTVKFGGTYVKLTSTDKPGLQAFSTIGSFSPSAYVNPFCAYFTTNAWASSAAGIFINAIFDDEATGISMILSKDGELSPVSGNIYDANGRFVGTDAKALPKGMYIINGKKIVK